MALSIAQKLRIKEGMKLLTLHAPSDFADALQPLPPGVRIASKGKDYAQVHWFVKSRAQMEQEADEVLGLLHGDVLCWIYYPKGTSGIQTDLTRDKGWEALLRHETLQWLSLISFDDTWSSFGMRLKTSADDKKPPRVAPEKHPAAEYVDRVAKTVRLPDDLEKALKQHKGARAFFDGLAFSHRREYVEWIVGAKRAETRSARIKGTLERLEKGWKNPTSGDTAR